MANPQYAILRFAKYKGPEIGRIEAHNERTKGSYASNPDIDPKRTHLNFHLVGPQRKYRVEAEKQIAEAQCRTRSDSVRVVEALITASPEFFEKKTPGQVKAFFEDTLRFIQTHQAPETIISAVVHMDEKTPHIPPQIYKDAARLGKQQQMLMNLLSDIHPLNAKKRAAEIEALLDTYIPGVEKMQSQLKKFVAAFKQMKAEVDSGKLTVKEQMEIAQKLSEYEDLRKIVDNIPEEILTEYTKQNTRNTEEKRL